jgi:RNA polymerase sigma-70 factor (ECF subfamily)
MDRVRDGDIRQLAPLFERHHLKLYNFYLRMTGQRQLSEDLVQEVFFRMLKYRHTFRGDGEFATWMYHLARNVHRDHYRKWQHEPPSAGDQEEPATAEPPVQEVLEQRQDRELLAQALARLPAGKRELLILSRYQDLRYDAIAELLGCSVEAVKVRVHRATNELRTIFFQLSGEKSDE